MGAWIEIAVIGRISSTEIVAPHVGAWIEIAGNLIARKEIQSHPMWVRGLKCYGEISTVKPEKSHPMWVRGLKFVLGVVAHA